MITQLRFQHYYLIGIKGQAMTALAQLLLAWNKQVMGSDTAEVFSTDAILQQAGIVSLQGFEVGHIDQLDKATSCVVYSPAYGADNPEVAQATALGLPLYRYEEFVGPIFSAAQGIAVVGTHGKTTTTAMTGLACIAANLDPTVVVGFVVPQLFGNVRIGRAQLLIWEVDEYKNKMQHFTPFGAIVTNVDYDHVDFYPNKAAYEQAFLDFFKKIPPEGFLVYCAEDRFLREHAKKVKCQTVSYGLTQGEWRLENMSSDKQSATVMHHATVVGTLRLQVWGEMNLLNALGAFVVGVILGGSTELLLNGLASYNGTKRRMEMKGEAAGITVVDDYAHHPVEIAATLDALRSRFPGRRLVCAFHPHTISRTRAFAAQFASALQHFDAVAVVEAYASARETSGDFSAKVIFDALQTLGKRDAVWAPESDDVLDFFSTFAKPGDVVVTMGAGDIWQIGEKFIKEKNG